jgi:hypothetical protein
MFAASFSAGMMTATVFPGHYAHESKKARV